MRSGMEARSLVVILLIPSRGEVVNVSVGMVKVSTPED